MADPVSASVLTGVLGSTLGSVAGAATSAALAPKPKTPFTPASIPPPQPTQPRFNPSSLAALAQSIARGGYYG